MKTSLRVERQQQQQRECAATVSRDTILPLTAYLSVPQKSNQKLRRFYVRKLHRKKKLTSLDRTVID
jgi:hypothetical protein